MTCTGLQDRARLPQTDPIRALLASPLDLPVIEALPELHDHLFPSSFAFDDAGVGARLALTVPPGTGRTTLIPPLLAGALTDVPTNAPGRAQECRLDRVIVTQPWHTATHVAAYRLIDLLGEEVGGIAGYAMHGERCAGPVTRIEVTAAGLLLRRLQRNLEPSGIDTVILDEAHERSLGSDLLLALPAGVCVVLHGDLTLTAMSATLDADRLYHILSDSSGEASDGTPDGATSLMEVLRRLYPLEETWAPPGRTGRLGPRGVSREPLSHVATIVEWVLAGRPGGVLVFLPGVREADDVVSCLHGVAPRDAGVLPPHGCLLASAQDAALIPSPVGRWRVVVAANVAESSLTMLGARMVVDPMLTYELHLDVARSISGLVMVGVSRVTGMQWAGWAGCEGLGAAYRRYSPTDWACSLLAPTPEILPVGLAGATPELAVRGVPGGVRLTRADELPAAASATAREALECLGLAGADGATSLGRAVVGLPAGVREAQVLLATVPILGAWQAAWTTMLLTADLRAPGEDLTALARQMHGGGIGSGAWEAKARRLEQVCRRAAAEQSGIPEDPGSVSGGPQAPSTTEAADSPDIDRKTAGRLEDPDPASDELQAPGVSGALSSPGVGRGREGIGQLGDIGQDAFGSGEGTGTHDLESAVALVAGTAQPQRIARRRGPAPQAGKEAHYASVTGTGLCLPTGPALAESERLIVASAGPINGRDDAPTWVTAPLDEQVVLKLAGVQLVGEKRTVWESGWLRTERLRHLGAITFTITPGPSPGPTVMAEAVATWVRAGGADAGLGMLPWDKEALGLRARLALLHEYLDELWSDIGDVVLAERAEEWLASAVVSLARQAVGSNGIGRSGESAPGSGSRRLSLERPDAAQALRMLLP